MWLIENRYDFIRINTLQACASIIKRVQCTEHVLCGPHDRHDNVSNNSNICIRKRAVHFYSIMITWKQNATEHFSRPFDPKYDMYVNGAHVI